jgi:hypothetical protein
MLSPERFRGSFCDSQKRIQGTERDFFLQEFAAVTGQQFVTNRKYTLKYGGPCASLTGEEHHLGPPR